MIHAYTMPLGTALALFMEGIVQALSCGYWLELFDVIPADPAATCVELPYYRFDEPDEPLELSPSEVYTIVVDSQEGLTGFMYLDLLLEDR